MVFPYKNTAGQFYPIIKLSLIYQETKFTIEALVDSGANISVFGADIAESLGVKIESGKRIFLGGVGGRILGYEHKIDMELAGKRFNAKVVFSAEYVVSFNLVGRADVFDKFTICFDEARKQLELKPKE